MDFCREKDGVKSMFPNRASVLFFVFFSFLCDSLRCTTLRQRESVGREHFSQVNKTALWEKGAGYVRRNVCVCIRNKMKRKDKPISQKEPL